ncbi:MAG: DUF484 family protein [Proteobacteria bacterium]|nr:DUF484 family protein [Pseudomonadota bacterium]
MSEQNIKASEVIAFLHENPSFFVKYQGLLTGLKVTSKKGDLTNLVNHQVTVLQEKNHQSKLKLKSLIKNAQNNEMLMDKLFQLLIRLSNIKDHDAYIEAYVDFIRKNFQSDYFKLLLSEHKKTENDEMTQCPTKLTLAFDNFTESNEPISGRLKKDKIQHIFPAYDEIKSAIVLAVGDKAKFGIMVFASKDENTFHPDKSSDILQKLAEILAVYLTEGLRALK